MNLNKILLGATGGLVLIILAVTAISLASSKASPGKNLVKIQDAEQSDKATFTPAVTPEKTTFTKLGQLRIATKPDSSQKRTVIILTPVLEYRAEDDTFYEELNSKTIQLKDLITGYMSSMTTEEINKKGEDKIKQELLNLINSTLVLQQIQTIYFNDYQFI